MKGLVDIPKKEIYCSRHDMIAVEKTLKLPSHPTKEKWNPIEKTVKFPSLTHPMERKWNCCRNN